MVEGSAMDTGERGANKVDTSLYRTTVNTGHSFQLDSVVRGTARKNRNLISGRGLAVELKRKCKLPVPVPFRIYQISVVDPDPHGSASFL
jgi:hypothetical protein